MNRILFRNRVRLPHIVSLHVFISFTSTLKLFPRVYPSCPLKKSSKFHKGILIFFYTIKIFDVSKVYLLLFEKTNFPSSHCCFLLDFFILLSLACSYLDICVYSPFFSWEIKDSYIHFYTHLI